MFRHYGFWFLIAALLIGVFAVYKLNQDSRRFNPLPAKPVNIIYPKFASEVTIFPADPLLGEYSAPVKIIQFSDFACPYCASAAPVLRALVEQYKNKVALIWKDFPLPESEQGWPAAIAAQCAAQQNKFWQYHDKLFQNQSALSPALYQQLAVELKLDAAKFQNCFDKHASAPLINRNIDEAKAIGVDGTPFLIINGQVYSGTINKEGLDQAVQAILSK